MIITKIQFGCCLSLALLVLITMAGCKDKSAGTSSDELSLAKSRTTVQTAFPTDTVHLMEAATWNATACYLLKSAIKANTTGFITKMTVRPGDRVLRGQILFELKTKESQALGNTINQLDPSFQFSGVSSVRSPAAGFVLSLTVQTGDYVQEGDVLATVADKSSFGFIMNIPYEYHQRLKEGQKVVVYLPDRSDLAGYVERIIPSVDPVAQTQQVFVKVKSDKDIPENLIATTQLVSQAVSGLFVPKTAVLTDDTQSVYWVMKMINDSTAVKIPVQKGIENEQWVQVNAGDLKLTDRIIVSGNYGMGDTALVTVQP